MPNAKIPRDVLTELHKRLILADSLTAIKNSPESWEVAKFLYAQISARALVTLLATMTEDEPAPAVVGTVNAGSGGESSTIHPDG